MARPDDRSLVAEALPGYSIGDELGRGAFGIVVAGVHTTLERPVAIKQLPSGLGLDPDARNRFLGEGRLLASMDHPHIVPIFDFVEHDGMCLLVMERLTGGTLRARLQSGGVEDRFVVAAALAAATGLAYAHGRGVLHRDVKPENLMFNGEGVLKVTDFGIAKVLGSGASAATRAGYAIGTPAYMAPEQALGQELGAPADVYALGTVVFEALAGRLPYPDTADPVASLYQHVHEEAMPLAEGAPDVPLPICDAVDGALAREVGDRWPTAEAFKEALAAAAEEAWGAGWTDQPGLPLRTLMVVPPGRGSSPTVPDARPPRRPPRWAVVAAGAALLVAVAAGVLALRPDHHDQRAGTSGASSRAVFSVTPTKGPVGTVVTLTSTTPCPAVPERWSDPREAWFEIDDQAQIAPDNPNGGIDGGNPHLDADGAWSFQIAIPGGASPGDLHFAAGCDARNPSGEPDTYSTYDVRPTFTVVRR
jgi:hypothetical protein